jgi:hypothetical protein
MLTTLTPARIPDEDEALREPVRVFLKAALRDRPPEVRARSWMGYDSSFSQALGARKWIGLTLPAKYGGGERSPFARFVVSEELLAAGAPVAAHWFADRQSAPLLVRFGTERQCQQYLPGICRGETYFAVGMSEPGAGSDLASVRTRATAVTDGWRLSGMKIWTTNAHRSHYIIVLARSSGTPEDRHKGLSQFIVDLSLPGITVSPITDLNGDVHFSEVRFDDVLLGEDALVGSEGHGWEQVVAELSLERSGPERIYSSIVLLDRWIASLRGESLDRATAMALGRMVGELAVLRALSLAVTSRLAAGESPVVEASLVKDLGTTFEQRVPVLIAELVGARPELLGDPALRRTLDFVISISPSFSLRGGTREILRGIIARSLSKEGSLK